MLEAACLLTGKYGNVEREFDDRTLQAADQRFRFFLGAGDEEVIGAGQIISLQGRVDVQRAGRNDWSPARERMAVFNGDYIRTGSDGTSEVLFADGTLYRVAPDSLLEIHHQPHRNSCRHAELHVP